MYSQYGEDDVIAQLFGNRTGRLLDIGAFHPTVLSNSRLLIERDWEAVLVEFSPAPVRALVKEYGNNPKIKILQAAISTQETGMVQFQISDDGLSTADPGHLEKWKEAGGYFGQLWVPSLTIAQILNQFGGDFQFVSIDTEGWSVPLAMNLLNECEQRPDVLCVEHDGRIIELQQFAQQFGYRAHWTNGTNVILVK